MYVLDIIWFLYYINATFYGYFGIPMCASKKY